MPLRGRKNVHGRGGVQFKSAFTTSKRKAKLRNMATSLIVNDRIETTFTFAKELQPFVEKLVTYGKKGDLNSRRLAAKYVYNVYLDEKKEKKALQQLFDDIAPKYKDVNGGYTRVLKTSTRRGDNTLMAIIEFV